MSNGNGQTSTEEVTVNQAQIDKDERIIKEVLKDYVFAANESYYYFQRRQSLERLSHPKRDLYKEAGYEATEDLTPLMFLDLYERFPIATRVIDLPVDEAWRKQPRITEGEDKGKVTEFEKAWDNLDENLNTEKNHFLDAEGSQVFEKLIRADRLSRIGQYGVIFLEFDDVGQAKKGGEQITWRDPAPGFSESEDGSDITINQEETESKQKVKLIGIRAFDQTHAEISEWYENDESTVYGRPRRYRLRLEDQRENFAGSSVKGSKELEIDVHWSRIIHIPPDGLKSSEYISTPACQPVLNELQDIRKVYAASGEGYWRYSFPGMSFETHPNLGAKVEMDTEALKTQVELYKNTLDRVMMTKGGTWKMLQSQPSDPTAHIEIRIEAICIHLGCPVRIFKGSERGELASSQDKDSWDERMIMRQHGHITPFIIVPFVNRLITAGVLPIPREGFSVDWPDLSTLSKLAKAELAVKLTEAIVKYVSGGGDTLIDPVNFLVRIMEFEQEEAKEIVKSTIDHINAANPEEDDVDVAGRNPKPALPEGEEGQFEEEGPPQEEEEDIDQLFNQEKDNAQST